MEGNPSTWTNKKQKISIERKSFRSVSYQNDTVEALFEPGYGVLLFDTVLKSDACLFRFPPCHTCTRPTHHDIEVHTEYTNGRVVSGTQINVLLDPKSKVSCFREIALPEFVFLDLQATLKDFLGLGATDGDVNGDLFVTTDTEGSDGVTSLGGNGGLTGELFENLGCSGETITRFTDGDVYSIRKATKFQILVC